MPSPDDEEYQEMIQLLRKKERRWGKGEKKEREEKQKISENFTVGKEEVGRDCVDSYHTGTAFLQKAQKECC